MKCGREIGGDRAVELGICPVSSEFSADGLNGGVNGGRICWIMDKNGCNNKVMQRADFCFQCEFRYRVMNEEGLINVCKATGFLLSNLADKKDLTNKK
jgi:hypothetical protein